MLNSKGVYPSCLYTAGKDAVMRRSSESVSLPVLLAISNTWAGDTVSVNCISDTPNVPAGISSSVVSKKAL